MIIIINIDKVTIGFFKINENLEKEYLVPFEIKEYDHKLLNLSCNSNQLEIKLEKNIVIVEDLS